MKVNVAFLVGASLCLASGAAPLPFEGWFCDPLGWRVQSGGVKACGVNGFAWSQAPCASRVRFSAKVTPERVLSRDGWPICGLSIGTDEENRWSLQLVRAPDERGAKRYFEFFEVLEGKGLRDSMTGLKPRASVGTDVSWTEGETYVFAIELDGCGVSATVADASGRVIWSRGHYFGTARAVRSGAPALRSHPGLTVSFTDLDAEASGICGGLAGRPAPLPAPSYAPVGVLREKASRATGFFRVERPADGRWRVIDPLGNETFLRGVDHVRYAGHCTDCTNPPRRYYKEWNDAHYPSVEAWAEETIGRLRDWGFNMLGGDPSRELLHRGLPAAVGLNVGKTLGLPGRAEDLMMRPVGGGSFPNVFHPDFARWCDYWATVRCAPNRNDPWIVGYFLDNELEWGAHGPNATGLYDMSLSLEPGHSARQAAEAFARSRGVANPAEASDAVKSAFLGLAAEKYFSSTVGAIRRHDPNHLVLGVRFAGLAGADPLVWEVCGKYCDIISVNCYPWVDLDSGEALTCRGRDAEWVADAFARFSGVAGKPLMVTEWSFPALDAGLPSTCGCGQRFRTQRERAVATAAFARTMISLPCVVGYDYFMWVDQPPEGLRPSFGENSNYGLVSEKGVVYRDVAEALKAQHSRVVEIRRKGWKRPQSIPASANPPMTSAAFAAANALEPAARLTVSHDVWRWSNAAGMALSGRRGASAPVESVTLDGEELGRFNGMVQMSHNGTWSFVDAAEVVDFRRIGNALAVTARGGAGKVRFELDFRITLDESRPAFLAELAGLRSIGDIPVVCADILLRQYSPFMDESPSDVPDLWGAPWAAAWFARDGRWFGACTRSPEIRRFWYWSSHPDAVYAVTPSGTDPLTLKPGEARTFGGRVWELCIGGTKGGRKAFERFVSEFL